jgi:hypothetical protein
MYRIKSGEWLEAQMAEMVECCLLGCLQISPSCLQEISRGFFQGFFFGGWGGGGLSGMQWEKENGSIC